MSAIIIECQQGDADWHQSRAGCITASMFGIVRAKVGMPTEQQQQYVAAILANKGVEAAKTIAGYKQTPTASVIEKLLSGAPVGEWSDAAKNYAFRLACERIAGESLDDTFETWAMRRGRELEEECRKRHEIDINQPVSLAGFVRTEDGKFGCSADSLVEPEGGAEYKAFFAAEKVRPILTEDNWGDIADQVQGCIWITGAKWWDQCLYFPALKSIGRDFTRRRVMRDDNYIEKMEADLIEFDALVCQWESKLRNK